MGVSRWGFETHLGVPLRTASGPLTGGSEFVQFHHGRERAKQERLRGLLYINRRESGGISQRRAGAVECRLGTVRSEHLGIRSGTRGGGCAAEECGLVSSRKETLCFRQWGPYKREMGIKGSLKKS